MHREMEVRMSRGYNPLHINVMVTRFPYSQSSQKKGGFCARKHTHTYTHINTLRDGSATVAAGHTSGGTVGQQTRVREGKMNKVAQRRLMISEGMRRGRTYPSCQCH